MSDALFYHAFESRFRGSRELVEGRLHAYAPFVQPLLRFYPGVPAIDLGCGRGEWVGLLQRQGFNAFGVDLDDAMLAVCAELKIPAARYDAIEYLTSLPDESQGVVSGFHFAEHLQFSALQTVVAQSLRVLRPGGLLILETPNPENIVVGSMNFYLDPTHQRPLPPALLAFLPEYYGFARTKLVRLQESPSVASLESVQLLDVLAGASPDYAVVAQKHASSGLLQAFDAVFSAAYGIELRTLAQRYDQTLGERFGAVEARLDRTEAKSAQDTHHVASGLVTLQGELNEVIHRAGRVESSVADLQAHVDAARVQLLEAELEVARSASRTTELQQQALHAVSVSEGLRRDLVDLQARNRAMVEERSALVARASKWEQAHEKQRIEANQWWRASDQLTKELQRVHRSLSWRLTSPLRWVAARFRRADPGVASGDTLLRSGFRVLSRHVRKRPRLQRWIGAHLVRFPAFKRRLRIMESAATESAIAVTVLASGAGTARNTSRLGRAGLGIYTALRREIDQRGRSSASDTS